MSNSRISTLSARKAANIRWGNTDPEVERDLAAERIADYVARVVAEAPPLSNHQLDRIAVLLRPAGGGA